MPMHDAMTTSSSQTTNPIDPQELRRKNERLPLAIVIHYNWFLSLIFAILTGSLAFEKTRSFFFCNGFQRTLLRPIFLIWLIAEFPRLYVGQKGVLCDKVSRDENTFRDALYFISMFMCLAYHTIVARACIISAAVILPSNLDCTLSRFSSRNNIANRHRIR